MREDGVIVIGAKIETKEFDKQIDMVEKRLNDLERSYEKAKGKQIIEGKAYVGDEKALKSLEVEIEKTKNKLISLQAQKAKVNRTPIEDTKNLDNISNGMTTIIKKAKQWGLAIFSVRSAYTLIRHSVSTLTANDEKLKADIDYINYAIASALKPIIEYIIQLVYKLLSLINDVAYSLFGVNLFGNATAKSFANSNKNAKELKRTLAGFDEMNVLDGGGSGSGSGSLGTPSYDLSNIKSNAVSLKKLAETQKELGKSHEALQAQAERSTQITKTLTDKYLELAKSEELTKEQGQALTNSVRNSIEVDSKQALKLKELSTGGNLWERTINGITGNTANWRKEMWLNIDSMISVANELDKMYKTGQMDNVQKRDYIATLETLKKTFKELGLPIEAIQKKLDIFKNTKYAIQFAAEIETNGLDKTFKNIQNIIKSTMPTALATPVLAVVEKYRNQLIKAVPNIKHAKGGIINNPGAGVPLGYGHIGGEAGIEGIVPLTDSQQMTTLGEAIGRYVNINLTNNTNLDGRTIARQVTKLQNNNDFATNR